MLKNSAKLPQYAGFVRHLQQEHGITKGGTVGLSKHYNECWTTSVYTLGTVVFCDDLTPDRAFDNGQTDMAVGPAFRRLRACLARRKPFKGQPASNLDRAAEIFAVLICNINLVCEMIEFEYAHHDPSTRFAFSRPGLYRHALEPVQVMWESLTESLKK